MVCNLMDFPTIEDTLDMISRNRIEIDYLQHRLVELTKGEESRKEEYKNRSGMTYEDLFGVEKAAEIKQKISNKIRGTRSGKNNPAYKHGKTGFHSKIRRMIEYRQWRSNICQRDNWTCQTCGIRGVELDVHHIISFAKIVNRNMIEDFSQARECDELWDIENGVVLCKGCHNLITKKVII